MMKISSNKIFGINSSLIFTAILTGLLFIFSACSDNSNRIVDTFGIEEFSAPKTTDADSLERNDQSQPAHIIIHYNIITAPNGRDVIITIGAMVMDYYASPVPNIDVTFGIDRDGPYYFKKIANTNQSGTAITELIYPPSRALDWVRFIATASNIADTTAPFQLPIIQPVLNITADPETLWVYRPETCDTSTITCQLTDWMGNPIDNGLIVFVALVAGELCGPTTQYTNANGIAETKYRIWYEQIPGGPSNPSSIEVGVRAVLFGYPDVEEEMGIWCYRP